MKYPSSFGNKPITETKTTAVDIHVTTMHPPERGPSDYKPKRSANCLRVIKLPLTKGIRQTNNKFYGKCRILSSTTGRKIK